MLVLGPGKTLFAKSHPDSKIRQFPFDGVGGAQRNFIMEVPDSFYSLVETTCRDLYIRSLKDIPPDIVAAIKAAAQTETKEVAKRIFSHYIQSIELGQTKDMIVCQDTGIPIYWVDIGGKLRLDGAGLGGGIVQGTERATREHPLR